MITTLNTEHCKIEQLITHHVGNSNEEEGYALSEKISVAGDDTTYYLQQYFLSPFKPVDFFHFNHSVSLPMNEVYSLTQKIFADESTFIEASQSLAKLLYDKSSHPNIKSGELNVALIKGLTLNGEFVDALGLFKSESNEAFLKMDSQSDNYRIDHEFGFSLKGLDKACLIFNIEEDMGYQVLVVDKKSKATTAHYWIDDFLELKPCNDAYNNTKEFLSLTKNYVTQQLPNEFEVEPTDKIDLLNRTMDYFKANTAFDQQQFEQEVFADEAVINSFRAYDTQLRNEQDFANWEEGFNINNHAVKKQSRIYKSVLKLDRNFHVYIHGNKQMIEKGVEPDGRKFYKLYYVSEE